MVEKEGNDNPEMDMIAQATQAAERLEKANAEQKEIFKKMEALEARRVLGGQASAGQITPEHVETPKEYAARMLRGGV